MATVNRVSHWAHWERRERRERESNTKRGRERLLFSAVLLLLLLLLWFPTLSAQLITKRLWIYAASAAALLLLLLLLLVVCCQPVFISVSSVSSELRPFVAAVVLVRCKLANCIIFLQLHLDCGGFTFAALSLHHYRVVPLLLSLLLLLLAHFPNLIFIWVLYNIQCNGYALFSLP